MGLSVPQHIAPDFVTPDKRTFPADLPPHGLLWDAADILWLAVPSPVARKHPPDSSRFGFGTARPVLSETAPSRFL